jgi:hypothetical protein
VSGEAGYRPDVLDGRLALVLEGGRLVRDRTDELSAGAQLLAIRGRVRYLPITASARYERAVGTRQRAWVGGGAGVAHVASSVSAGSAPARSESGVVPSLRAAAAWGLRLGHATAFAEAGLAWHGPPGFEALRGSLTVVTVSLGCRYDAY